jgi:hypothetical protein
MSKGKGARKQLTKTECLRREIEILEALLRRGGITLVMADDQLITAYPNDRKVLR